MLVSKDETKLQETLAKQTETNYSILKQSPMATKKKAATKKRKAVQRNESLPAFSFRKIFFIDWRAERIVHGQIQVINTIRKPKFDNEGRLSGEKVDHYYTMRTEVSEESITVHEEHLFTTNVAASIALGRRRTDLLK